MGLRAEGLESRADGLGSLLGSAAFRVSGLVLGCTTGRIGKLSRVIWNELLRASGSHRDPLSSSGEAEA